jgi:formyl-CoA transferase
MLQTTTFDDCTEAPITGPSAKFSRTPTKVRSAAPSMGQHTDEVLAELGLSEAERRALADAGITE